MPESIQKGWKKMNKRITRREMLTGLCGVAGVGLLGGCQGVLLGDNPKKPDRLKIGACDWSLEKQADPESLAVASRLGLDGVQISLGTRKSGMILFRPEVQRTFLDTAKKYDMEISSIAIGRLNSVPYKSEVLAEQWVSDCIDVCRAMNVKIILLAFFGKGDLRDDRKGIDVVVERLKKVAPKAESAGVSLGIESLLSAAQHMDIIDRVGSPAVRVYYDVGNSHKMGYNSCKEIRWLGRDNICEIHAKDYNNLFGQGKIDFVKVHRALKEIDYRGWIHIERSKPGELMADYRHNVQYLRSIFGADV
jgi:sugar phosphate isomerase/epimerase